MSLNPRVCKKSYKVHIPMMGEACEFWLITVTDEQSITNPDKDHAYLTDDGKLFVFNGDSLVRVNCDICFTQEEREKLEGIEENANNYTLPEADSNHLGGVVLGYTQNGRNYPITKDTKGNIYVNVPWEEYQLPKATDNALGGIKTGYKQNGKFYPIKTDTDGNAYVQVPWEDTNTVYEVVSKTSNGLMPMLPSDENASKSFLNGDGEWVVGTDNSINGITQTGSTFSGETSDCGVQIVEVKGKTTQQTTNGYQLFDASKLPTKSQGGATVTNNGDGSFTVSGSGAMTSSFLIDYVYTHEETVKLLKAGTLTANFGASTLPYFYVQLAKVTNEGTEYILSLNNNNKQTNSATITEEMISNPNVILRISIYASVGTIKTGTIKPMLYQDGDGTWESFTGGKSAPNPDYPMPIENVEISKLVSYGKNIISGIPSEITHARCTHEYDNVTKELTIKATGNDAYIGEISSKGNTYKSTNGTLYLVPKNATKVYFRSENGVLNSINITFYDEEKISLGFAGRDYTIPKNTKYVSFRIGVNPSTSGTSYTDKVYASFDEISGDYVDGNYEEVETSLTLAQDDIYENNVITRKRNKIVFDGSSDESWNQITNNRFVISVSDVSSNGFSYVISICNRLKSMPQEQISSTSEWGVIACNNGAIYVRINENVTTVEQLRTWLQTHNLVVEYELATPTTEEFKVPTIPSYEPYTEISTNSVVDPTITFRPLPFTTCLVGEATEEESGYMPPLSGNSNEFLNGNGEWSVPSGYTLPTASSTVLGGVKIGSNISISGGAISIDKDNVTKALGYTPPTANTTYEKVDKSSDGLCPKLPNETTTTKYLRQDGAWAVPPNTTYGVASTSANGLMSSSDKTKLTNLRRIWKGTSSSPPSGWVDGDIYVQYEE
ncbi:hypothetical protein B5F14_01565 [Faecalitalea cylindroides]|uniref:Uncharacterized protein n=1 Tax=Faecalitalea cylindroides TaxID=39483 RepID=A0A1Y4M1A0_9FIRM|nr:hypothetical protein [Faecalitalea cylindroides]OUP61669.1 hypothetical protein B5F14_01565 [Faecalitalea cylindroides]